MSPSLQNKNSLYILDSSAIEPTASDKMKERKVSHTFSEEEEDEGVEHAHIPTASAITPSSNRNAQIKKQNTESKIMGAI